MNTEPRNANGFRRGAAALRFGIFLTSIDGPSGMAGNFQYRGWNDGEPLKPGLIGVVGDVIVGLI
jgi:hypothetical protein